jgi:hypothetical protein
MSGNGEEFKIPSIIELVINGQVVSKYEGCAYAFAVHSGDKVNFGQAGDPLDLLQLIMALLAKLDQDNQGRAFVTVFNALGLLRQQNERRIVPPPPGFDPSRGGGSAHA